MAASVRIEDEAFGDGRYEHLGHLLGTSKYDALGRMAFLWRQCTQEQRHVLPESFVCVFIDADKLCESRLGERVDGGIRICGTRGRIEWLAKLRKNGKFGKLGGRPKRNPRGLPGGYPQGGDSETPPAPAPAPAPAPREGREERPAADPAHSKALRDKVDKAARMPSASPFPGDWEPKGAHRDKARAKALDLAFEAEQFRNNAGSKGLRYVDWDLAFHTWLNKSAQWRDERGGPAKAQQSIGIRETRLL